LLKNWRFCGFPQIVPGNDTMRFWGKSSTQLPKNLLDFSFGLAYESPQAGI